MQSLLRRPTVLSAGRHMSLPVRAVAAPDVLQTLNPQNVPIPQLDDGTRSKVAKALGYRQLGKALPEGVTLGQIVKSLPKQVFELNPWRAWGAVVTSLVAMAAAEYAIAVSPWYLLPLAWAFAGTAFTGFFVVGHDCAHRSFSKNKLVEDIVGTLIMAPLIYPMEAWRVKHNVHHANTNKLVEDTAWHPVMEEQTKTWDPVSRFVYQTFLGTPLKLFASVGHQALYHFDLGKFSDSQKARVTTSIAVCAAFAATALPALVHFTGWFGLVKFWLMPWLGYHFWMSTFTVIHHTAPHIPFKGAEEWDAAVAQLNGTVHCDFPAWVEFLTHDISVHVPHHVSTGIPWYNLRAANESLRANWGEYMTECTFNWRMMKTIFTELHVYDAQNNYKPFDWQEEKPLWRLQRLLLPESM